MKTTLQEIFYSLKEDDELDPNNPAHRPAMNAMRGIENKAFIRWMEDCGGEVLLKNMQRSLVGKIQDLIMQSTTTVDGILQMVEKKKEIQRDIVFMDRIKSAFDEEEKRLEDAKQ